MPGLPPPPDPASSPPGLGSAYHHAAQRPHRGSWPLSACRRHGVCVGHAACPSGCVGTRRLACARPPLAPPPSCGPFPRRHRRVAPPLVRPLSALLRRALRARGPPVGRGAHRSSAPYSQPRRRPVAVRTDVRWRRSAARGKAQGRRWRCHSLAVPPHWGRPSPLCLPCTRASVLRRLHARGSTRGLSGPRAPAVPRPSRWPSIGPCGWR